MNTALRKVSLWLYFSVLVMFAFLSFLLFFAIGPFWLLAVDLLASGILAASVALFALGKKVEFWWPILVLGLGMQAIVFYIDGPPRTVLDLLVVILLVAPSTVMGIKVSAKAT